MDSVISISILTSAALLLVFLPKVGLRALLLNWQTLKQREQMEDALKHLLEYEQENRHATPESLAGRLGWSQSRVYRLLAKMENQNLLSLHGHALHLTSEGERWALQIVRAHRLWERYLADEARMPLVKIHAEAHRREHSLSVEELDALDASLGFPSHDPHGDPIPSREGDYPGDGGTELTAWEQDSPARIVHLEDEPEIALAQILAAGLRLGQVVRILERTPELILLSDGENEYRLAPVIAANIHVARLQEDESLPAEAIPLSSLMDDNRAEIVAIDRAVQGFTRRRFLDLGLTPGTTIYPELKNFFGDPRAYRVRGTLIALRDDQAALIWVRPDNDSKTIH